jgi:hypothetical protein
MIASAMALFSARPHADRRFVCVRGFGPCAEVLEEFDYLLPLPAITPLDRDKPETFGPADRGGYTRRFGV